MLPADHDAVQLKRLHTGDGCVECVHYPEYILGI